MRQKYIEVNGIKTFYYESKDHGNPVIMVHGASSSSSVFVRQLIDSVLSYQFRIIAFDLVGHGKTDYSKNPETDYTVKGQSRFLVDFCKALAINDAVFTGHGTGGNVILEAYKNLKNPRGVVLLSSAPLQKPFDNKLFQKSNIIELMAKPGVDDSEVHQIAAAMVEGGTKYPDFIPDLIRSADLKTREYLFKSMYNGEYDDQMDTVKKINHQLAIYYGEYDQIIDFDYVNSLEIPFLWRNLVQIIRNSGNLFFYECPADFNISFEAYLNTVFL